MALSQIVAIVIVNKCVKRKSKPSSENFSEKRPNNIRKCKIMQREYKLPILNRTNKGKLKLELAFK